MKKGILKEIIIILLLVLAIILVLGVLLYEYVPANKIVPEKVSYTTPEEIKAELEEDVNENLEELYIDYHIDATQLNNYQKIQEYVPGKKNPFSSLENEETTQTTGTTTSNSGNSATSNSNATETNDEVDEDTGYLPDKGTK